MSHPKTHSKFIAPGALLLLMAVLMSLGVWVVSAPEFGSGRNRAFIERLTDAGRARLRQVGIVIGKRRAVGKKADVRKPSATPEVTGPATVLVVDSRGAPIPEVSVTFRSPTKAVKEKTSKSGRVSAKLPVGTYDVRLTHDKYSTEERTHQQIYGPNRGFDLNVAMQTRVAVKGLVVDEEGKPVAGAVVSGQRNWLQQFSGTGGVFLDDAAYPQVEADAKGGFRLDEVSIGSNTFVAGKTGYAPAETRMNVPSSGLSSPLKFTLKRPAHIAGRVVDEDRKPVAGVKITALQYQAYGSGAVDLPVTGFSITTGADGTFDMKKLFTDGFYRVKFEHPAYAVWEQPQISANTENFTLVLQRGGEISGRVEYLDRVTTPAAVEINAMAVVSGTTVTRMAMSMGNGNFSFQRLPYGAYELSVNFNGLVNEPRGRVASLKDRPTTGVLVEVYEAAQLAGSVVDAFSDEAIPGAQVIVKSTYGSARQRVRQFSIKADDRGQFVLKNLPGGLHQVTATARDYLSVSGDASDYTVPLSAGAKQKDYTIYLSKGGAVRGQVVSLDGEGIGEAEVQLYVASGSFAGLNVKDLNQTTDGSGFFDFSGFPIGQGVSLYVSARKAGYAKKHSELVELRPAQPEGATQVVMSPGGVISGRVVDQNKAPVYGVKITYDSREFPGDPSPTEFYTFTDSDGNYLLEHCSPGRAVLVADHDDYVRQTRSATVPEGRLLSRQNFTLKRAQSIRGTVADFGGHPIADAVVSAAPIGKATGSGRDRTDKSGDFEIKGLSEGDFRLEANFTLDTPDGKQAYTFILPSATAGSVGIPIDCDVMPGAVAKVLGESGRGVENYDLTFRARMDTDPKQLFRLSVVRSVKNAGGRLNLQKIPRGIYTMKIEAEGYETWESDDVQIGPGNMTRLPIIRLQPASQIKGQVVSATTGKAVQGALVRVLDDSKPELITVNRIELQSYSRTDIVEYLDAAYDENYKYDPDPNSRLVARVRGNVVTTLQTNVYGKFDINDLADGTYTLDFEHPAYRPKRIRNVRVGRQQTEDLKQVELDPGGTVRGRVTDLDGNGISNASVQLKGELQGRNRARTDIGGNFVLRGIGFGEWPVVVQATLDGRKVYAWKRISVRADETSFVAFVLETSADVSGRVIAPGGVKSGNVRLYAIDEAGAVLPDYVYSDAFSNLRYGISKIPPGRYFALASGKDARGDFAQWQWLDIVRGKNSVDFTGLTAGLSGVARNVATGSPSPGAVITFAMDLPGVVAPQSVLNLARLSVRADAKGRFSFPALQPGTYRVWTAASGGAQVPVDAVSLVAGQSVNGFIVAVPAVP